MFDDREHVLDVVGEGGRAFDCERANRPCAGRPDDRQFVIEDGEQAASGVRERVWFVFGQQRQREQDFFEHDRALVVEQRRQRRHQRFDRLRVLGCQCRR